MSSLVSLFTFCITIFWCFSYIVETEKCSGKCAYVVPTYELDERVFFPPNKTDLIRMANKGLARPFHHKVFIYNQYATNFTR